MLLLRPSSQCLFGVEAPALPLPRPSLLPFLPPGQMEVGTAPPPRPSGLVDATIDEEFARLLLPRYRKCVFGHSHNEIPGACLPPKNWIKDGKKVRVCRVPDCLNRINGYGFVCKTHGGGLCQWPDCTLYYQVRPCETPPLIPCIPSTYTHPPPPEKKGVTLLFLLYPLQHIQEQSDLKNFR